MSIASSFVSPMFSRVQSEVHPNIGSSRSQSLHSSEDFPEHPSPLSSREAAPLPYPVQAISALISIFSQLCFTPHASPSSGLDYVIPSVSSRALHSSLINGKSLRVRLAALQFLMRLRADRDHKLYFSDAGYDLDGFTFSIDGPGRSSTPPPSMLSQNYVKPKPVHACHRPNATARLPEGEVGPSQSFSTNATSRSRSRVSKLECNPQSSTWTQGP